MHCFDKQDLMVTENVHYTVHRNIAILSHEKSLREWNLGSFLENPKSSFSKPEKKPE